MKKNTLATWPVLLLMLLAAFGMLQTVPPAFLALRDTSPPVTEVWYGSHQQFGSPGLAQKWVNILGDARDAESGISSLSYRLNHGPSTRLQLGPDKRRLANPGDFNIEIDASSLAEGSNTVEIEAVNGRGMKALTQVAVDFHHRAWPLPYTIQWANVRNLQEVVQVLDGRWAWDANGVRPLKLAYDRALAIGDSSWTDYQVVVPVTVHAIDPNGYKTKESGGDGFGLNLRWLGFTDQPVVCAWPAQPHCGWLPVGASNWYSFKKNGVDVLAIEAQPPGFSTAITTRKLKLGHTYIFKAQVETTPAGNQYRLKVWEQGVESEPADWTIQRLTTPGDDVQGNLKHGSFLLVAHNVDITFGDIAVTPVSAP